MNTRCFRCWCLVLFCLLGTHPASGEDTAQDFFKMGLGKVDVEEYVGALAYFTRAIELQPNFAAALCERAYTQRQMRHFVAALYDHNRALELDPKVSPVHREPGWSRESDHQRYLDDALSEYTLERKSSPLGPKGFGGLLGRLYYLRRDWREALENFTGYVENNDGAYSENAFVWLLRARLADQDTANVELAGKLNKPKPYRVSDTPMLYAFLMGQISESAFLIYRSTVEEIPHRQSEDGWFFTGMIWENPLPGGAKGNALFFKRWLAVPPHRPSEASGKEDAWALMGIQSLPDHDATGISGEFKSWAKTIYGNMSPWEPQLYVASTSRRGDDQLIPIEWPPEIGSPYGDRARSSRTLYYVGMKRLFAGDRAGAIQSFRQCMENREQSVAEYQFAETELKALGG